MPSIRLRRIIAQSIHSESQTEFYTFLDITLVDINPISDSLLFCRAPIKKSVKYSDILSAEPLTEATKNLYNEVQTLKERAKTRKSSMLSFYTSRVNRVKELEGFSLYRSESVSVLNSLSSIHFTERPQKISSETNIKNMHANPNQRRSHFTASICGNDNEAVYGPCIASSFAFLEVGKLPTSEDPAYPGISFSVAIKKLDAYNQTIITDSFSAIQAQISLDSSLLGHSVASLVRGEALLSVVIRPIFMVRPQNYDTPVLVSKPRLRFEGIDSQSASVSKMVSRTFQIVFATEMFVCPIGYTLTFDQTEDSAQNSSQKIGSCIMCNEGSYSLSPVIPNCFSCPINAICSGGNSVEFLLGTWILENGMYKLSACPPGHQLLNSINGGGVSFALQQCVPCQSNQYILNSNMSNYTCQNCPVGAECDGISLRALVAGSEWEPDSLSGQYILRRCPPGYALINTLQNGRFSYVNQECSPCPAFYYCTGGSNAASACPQGRFSSPGSNSSDLCTDSTVVDITVSLEIAMSDFTAQKQKDFRTALALTSKQNLGNVAIQSFVSLHRSTASRLVVKASIAIKDPASARELSAAFDISEFNTQLAEQELPPCILISVSIESAAAQISNISLDRVLIGSLIGAVFFTALFIFVYIRHKGFASQDEKLLVHEISRLRIKLKIRQKDGFSIASDQASWWRRDTGSTFIQRSYIEAAAKLDLLMDFDVEPFDAFCLCLECGGLRWSNDSQELVNPSYSALCDWLLELCRNILRPDILDGSNSLESAHSGNTSRVCRLLPEQGFNYFMQKVSKARIWSCQTCDLFERLKVVVRDYMVEMSDHCHSRFKQIIDDTGGSALIALSHFPSDECLSGAISSIRRQDNEQVNTSQSDCVYTYHFAFISYLPANCCCCTFCAHLCCCLQIPSELCSVLERIDFRQEENLIMTQGVLAKHFTP